jgi:predicted phosphoadenosine phosphosulfate sulfurtransferase
LITEKFTEKSKKCVQQYSFSEQYDERLHKKVKMTTVLTNYRGANIYLSRMAIRTKENRDYSPKAELFAKFKKGQVWHFPPVP